MKQILEKGDRVKLVEADYVREYLGTTGTVDYVADEPNSDGHYTVRYVLDSESQQRMDKYPGFGVTASSAHLKYLKPKNEKKKAAKLDAKFTKKVDKLWDVVYNTHRAGDLNEALNKALEALDVLADTNSAGRNPSLKEIKEAMLEEIK